jgi:NAD(P)-dependent dehydrogenase (short-subunit alcohol dehydrogenase family)
MGNDLEGKVILLTGGARGIGRECALAYAREGATIAILDRNFEEAQGTAKEAGNRSNAYHADVSNGAEIQAALTAVLQEFGRLDAVHNNAGIVGPSCPLHETIEEQWDELQRTNLKSVYWTTRFAFSALVESKGAILNTASMVGLLGQQDHAAYVASKGGMISLTRRWRPITQSIRLESTRYALREHGRPCWSSGLSISPIPPAYDSILMAFTFSAIVLRVTSSQMRRCFCFLRKPDLSPDASCR